MAGWLDTPIADLVKNLGPKSDTDILPYIVEKQGQSYLRDNYESAEEAEQGLQKMMNKYGGSGNYSDKLGMLESYLRQYANSTVGTDYFVNDTLEKAKQSIAGKSDKEARGIINKFITDFSQGAFAEEGFAEAPATKRYVRQDPQAPKSDNSLLGVPLAQYAGDLVDKIKSQFPSEPVETPEDYERNYSNYDSDYYDNTTRQHEVVTDGNVWKNRLDIREQFDEDLKKSRDLREAARKKNTIAYDPRGAFNSFLDNFTSKAEAGEPQKESGLVNTVRDTMGIIDYMAPDGTNCTRTMGVVLQGTPYEGMVNIDQFDEMAELLHMKRDPETYKPKAGDIAVVNDGGHMIMITENGGFINNGMSRGGVWESQISYDKHAGKGKIDYYITTSDYENLYKGNTEEGAKELGIVRDKGKIYEQLQAGLERSLRYAPATGRTIKWGGKQ